jgi:cell division protein FtsI/penicillin-binding protein 2
MAKRGLRYQRAGAALALKIAEYNLRVDFQALERTKFQKRADGDTSKPVQVNVVNVQNLIRQALPNLSDSELQALVEQAKNASTEPIPRPTAG